VHCDAEARSDLACSLCKPTLRAQACWYGLGISDLVAAIYRLTASEQGLQHPGCWEITDCCSSCNSDCCYHSEESQNFALTLLTHYSDISVAQSVGKWGAVQ
jgi:hypothetical protein